MHYKMQLRGVLWTRCMNKSCTLWILDSIPIVRSVIAITNIFVWIVKLKIQNDFVTQSQTRYWKFVHESFCDGLKCNALSVVIFGDFLVAWFYELTFSRALFELFWTKILKMFGESMQHEIRHKIFTNHPISNRITRAWRWLEFP